jgi:hypothetical protein
VKRLLSIAEPYALCLLFWAAYFALAWAGCEEFGRQLDGWR